MAAQSFYVYTLIDRVFNAEIPIDGTTVVLNNGTNFARGLSVQSGAFIKKVATLTYDSPSTGTGFAY